VLLGVRIGYVLDRNLRMIFQLFRVFRVFLAHISLTLCGRSPVVVASSFVSTKMDVVSTIF
jgi:hypothetical protein